MRRGGVGERGREEGLRRLTFYWGRHRLPSPRVGGAMTVSRVEARRGALAAPAGDPLSQGEGEQGQDEGDVSRCRVVIHHTMLLLITTNVTSPECI